MSKYSLSLLQNAIEDYLEVYDQNLPESKDKIVDVFINEFPSLSYSDVNAIIEILCNIDKKRNCEKIDLSVTTPHSFSIKANSTAVTMEELLKNAERSILITGYSISDYFDDLIAILIYKIQRGVLVKLYLNDFENKKDVLDKLLLYKGKFLEIYNFNKSKNEIDALHAKVISVDSKKSLITSANLSFNGLQRNIEVGSVISSIRIAKNIEDIFYKLYKMKVFSKI